MILKILELKMTIMLKEKTTKYQELVRQLYGEEITTFLESNAPYLYLMT